MSQRTRYRIARPIRRTKRRKPVARRNPDAKPVFNKQGGVYPTTTFQLVRAKLVDLGTLPKNLCGTSCGSCIWYKRGAGKIGYCKHALVAQAVTARQCCALYRCVGWLTANKVVSQ